MKNRNLIHSDDWATEPMFYKKLNDIYNFDFDPCPLYFDGDPAKDGLLIEWGERNFINPPYSRQLKEAFVNRAIEMSRKGKLCVMLLPVSTSTQLFHNVILPNATIEFIKGRIQFIGINTKGEYVNWHLWDKKLPEGAKLVKNSGMHDSMIAIIKNK